MSRPQRWTGHGALGALLAMGATMEHCPVSCSGHTTFAVPFFGSPVLGIKEKGGKKRRRGKEAENNSSTGTCVGDFSRGFAAGLKLCSLFGAFVAAWHQLLLATGTCYRHRLQGTGQNSAGRPQGPWPNGLHFGWWKTRSRVTR